MINQNLNRISNKMNDYNVVINSISIDPKTDTPQKLSEYRTQNEFINSNWIFYTGDKSEIFKMAKNCKLKAFEDESQDNALVHDPTVVLLDKKNQIRGYYNGLKKEDISKLEKDIFELMNEHS
jgi:protein SCO1